MTFDLGLKLMSGGGAGGGGMPPETPPTGSGGEPKEPWRKPAREIMARNQSRWKQILWLLKNGRLTLAALKAAVWAVGIVAWNQLWTNATIWAWNHYGVDVARKRLRPWERRRAGQPKLSKGETEKRSIDRLPPWIRNRGGGWGEWAGTDYIISPFDFSGRDVQVFNRVGVGWEVLHWGGFDDMQAYVEAYHNGGMHGVAEWFGNRLVNSAVESVGPTKSVGELLIGESFHPDIFNRRLIPNRLDYAADSVMMGTVLRSLQKRPQPEGRSWWNLIGLNTYDGREQNYQETMDWMRTWRQYQPGLPKGVGDMAEDAKSAALHQFKKATRQGLDGTPYLKDYLLNNGTPEGLKSSFQRMTPLYGLMGEKYAGYRDRFLLGGWNPVTDKDEPGLNPEQRARIREAYWYVSDLAQIPVPAEARNNQAKQAILPFVVNMDEEIKGRMEAWLDPLIEKLKAKDPEVRHRLELLERAATGREATKPKPKVEVKAK